MTRKPSRGIDCAETQLLLAGFNARRLEPQFSHSGWPADVAADFELLRLEGAFMDEARRHVAPQIVGVPTQPDAFVAWFEDLRISGPGQGDPLFPWLAEHASMSQMRWFLEQEIAGEAGFDDLIALTQIKMPQRAKLEMARNYWDEMGRGAPLGMHGPMLSRLAAQLNISPTHETTVFEALALGNLMMALACNRRFAFQAVGALGVIEMTAPTRVGYVNEGLGRLGLSREARHYFALHETLDVKHSRAWNTEILEPLVRDDPRRAIAIAEGAILRLWCGARCFARYNDEFK
ncbi:MAG: iron-containing redox enzyme family protein, partial [Micropepsaceae bacterium]